MYYTQLMHMLQFTIMNAGIYYIGGYDTRHEHYHNNGNFWCQIIEMNN